MEKIMNLFRSGLLFALASHIRPDADTVGSVLALGSYLEREGKSVQYFCSDPIPPRLRFLPGAERFTQELPTKGLLVSVDVPTPRMLGGDIKVDGVIDHHPNNDIPSPVKWVEGGAAAAAMMVLTLVRTPTPEEATCLLAGILGDTGNLQFANTSPEVLRAVATLSEVSSIPMSEVVRLTSVMDDEDFRWTGRGMSSLHREGRFVLMTVDNGFAESLTRSLNQLIDCDLAVVRFVQEAGQYRIELRSPTGAVQCGDLARSLGGGGHARAAGVQDISEDRWEAVLEVLRRAVE